MKVLFDQGTPVPLRRHFPEHAVSTAFEKGWSELSNGELLDAAERAGFELLVTTDGNLQYQQNLTERRIAIVLLRSTSWPRIQKSISAIQLTVGRASSGTYEEVDIPFAG